MGGAFAVSPDASSVRFGLGFGAEEPVAFDLLAASLTDSPSLPSGFLAVKVDGLPVTDWLYTAAAEVQWRQTRARRRPVSCNGHSARRGRLRNRNRTGRYGLDAKGERLWRHVVPPLRGESISRPTVRSLWSPVETVRSAGCAGSDGEELLALFVQPQTRKWVAWTPSGYYMASPGGEDLIGWHVNRGWDQEADFFPASQFRAQYNRPDIVRLVLQTRDEAEASAAPTRLGLCARAMPVAYAYRRSLQSFRPPRRRAFLRRFGRDRLLAAFALGLPIDGSTCWPMASRSRRPALKRPIRARPKVVSSSTPPRKDMAVSLIAHSGDLTSAPVKVKLEYYGPSPADLPKPKLYALLVGVTGYQNPDYNNILYGAHDADELAKALMAQKGGLYADVQIKIVDDPTKPDADPTRSNVEDGSLLASARRDEPRSLDHLFFRPRVSRPQAEILVPDPRSRHRAAENNRHLERRSSRSDRLSSGQEVLLIDACHSGAAMTVGYKATPGEAAPDMNKVVNDFSTAGSGVVVFAASTGTELAKESKSGTVTAPSPRRSSRRSARARRRWTRAAG